MSLAQHRCLLRSRSVVSYPFWDLGDGNRRKGRKCRGQDYLTSRAGRGAPRAVKDLLQRKHMDRAALRIGHVLRHGARFLRTIAPVLWII